jgi:hypothetical protein
MDKCELCNREQTLTSHHLIPKQVHSKSWCKRMFTRLDMTKRRAELCRMCHKTIHKFFTHRELGETYNTVDKLLTNDKINDFIVWVKKQK